MNFLIVFIKKMKLLSFVKTSPEIQVTITVNTGIHSNITADKVKKEGCKDFKTEDVCVIVTGKGVSVKDIFAQGKNVIKRKQ